MNQELSIILRLKDEASKQLQGFQSKIDSMQPTFKKMATIGAISFGAIATAVGFATKEAIDAESAQNRLVQILKTTHGVTEEQIKLLNDQATALQKVGVVSDDNISIVQSQLATFDLTVDTLHKLTPSILDYVVAEKGANATTEDFKQMTNGLAQALQGNFASLTKTGFVLDDVTKEMISNGTEAERTEALVKVLGSTYADFNIKAKETSEGGLVSLKNSFSDIQKVIGTQFIPIIAKITETLVPVVEKISVWIQQNPELARNIIIATLAITGIIAVLGTLGIIIASITPLITTLGVVIGAISFPILLIIGLLTIIGIAIAYLALNWAKHWDNIKWAMGVTVEFMTGAWDSIKGTFKSATDWIVSNTLEPLMKWIDKVANAIERVREGIASIGGKVGSAVKNTASSIWSGAKNIVGVNDAIIAPNGNIISTHPDDYLIATKNPQSLGGGSITINIDTMVGDDRFAEEVGNRIIKVLALQNQLA
jgi:hypothetical protein